MSSCEYCMLLEDLVGFSSKDNYIAALGFVFNSIPRVEDVIIVPKSELERYKRGDYGWKVIESEKLPPNLNIFGREEALKRMCEKYGPFQDTDNTINVPHEERIRASNEIAGKLIQVPYVNSVFLTGSTAIGLDKDDSDVDLLVVLASCPGIKGHSDLNKLTREFYGITDIFYIQQKDFLEAQTNDLQYPLIKDRKLIAIRGRNWIISS